MGDTYHAERYAAAILGKHRASGDSDLNVGAIDLENCNLRPFLVGLKLVWSLEWFENVHWLAEMVKSVSTDFANHPAGVQCDFLCPPHEGTGAMRVFPR
jgi:hypothetical protein